MGRFCWRKSACAYLLAVRSRFLVTFYPLILPVRSDASKNSSQWTLIWPRKISGKRSIHNLGITNPPLHLLIFLLFYLISNGWALCELNPRSAEERTQVSQTKCKARSNSSCCFWSMYQERLFYVPGKMQWLIGRSTGKEIYAVFSGLKWLSWVEFSDWLVCIGRSGLGVRFTLPRLVTYNGCSFWMPVLVIGVFGLV